MQGVQPTPLECPSLNSGLENIGMVLQQCVVHYLTLIEAYLGEYVTPESGTFFSHEHGRSLTEP